MNTLTEANDKISLPWLILQDSHSDNLRRLLYVSKYEYNKVHLRINLSMQSFQFSEVADLRRNCMNTLNELRPKNVSRLKNDAKSVPLPYSPLVNLINCMNYLSPFLAFLDVVRILLMGKFLFPPRLDSEILCLLNAFLWPSLLSSFKSKINKHTLSLGFFLNIFSLLLLIFFSFSLATLYLVVTVQPYTVMQYQCFHLALQCNMLLSPEEHQPPGHQGR